MTINRIVLIVLAILFFSCENSQDKNEINVESILISSLKQLDLLIESAHEADRIPRSEKNNGEIRYTRLDYDWTEGFFPGTLWYAYSITKDEKYRKAADFFQKKYIDHRLFTNDHDLGFIFNNSFGAGYRYTNNQEYKQVLLDAANSLIQRFDPKVGCIKSWDVESGWQAQRGWRYPVIIDNLMNLEMLFEVSVLIGDSKYHDIAIQHANTSLKNHFREDNSSYHVVDYDPETGGVNLKQTAQGYSHESPWARGQAWGLYGYTMCYRYTKDDTYLRHAENIADFFLNHPNLPEDMIPYWDFNAPKIPNEPRDAAAATIVASALIELDSYSERNLLKPAKQIIKSLTSEAYTAKYGTNHNFILKHSVGSIPHGEEIDVPLNYADYYFIEALLRLKQL